MPHMSDDDIDLDWQLLEELATQHSKELAMLRTHHGDQLADLPKRCEK